MLISQQLRPDDLVRFSTTHFGLAPIAGLQMDVDVVTIAGLHLVRCNRAEWEIAERAYVFKDWHSQYYHANPVFLYKPYAAPISAEDFPAVLNDLALDGTRLVTACRLYKTGRLLEPVYTVRFVVSDAIRDRAVGPYRTEYLAMPVDGLTWPLDATEVDDVAQICADLALLQQTPGLEAFGALLDAFNLAHTPNMEAFFRLHVLFTVHEMLFDELREELQFSSNSYDRALAIARLMAANVVDAKFEALFERDIRQLRNAVVHHARRSSENDLGYVAHQLQIVAMVGIRLLMRFHHLEADPRFSTVRRPLGWRKLGAKEMMNACLDSAARKDYGPFEQVMAFR
jgi:hypothetical protein